MIATFVLKQIRTKYFLIRWANEMTNDIKDVVKIHSHVGTYKNEQK